MNASCRSCHLIMSECVLSCFSERVLKWERAVRKRLVGLVILLSVNMSCRVFRTHLDKGACRWNASCRSWRVVMSEYVFSCFSERVLKWERAIQKRLVDLAVLLSANTSCRVFPNAS